MSAINWTVQLVNRFFRLEKKIKYVHGADRLFSQSWGSSFFISLVDSSGQSWAFGPLHSGGQGPTGCLAGTSS